MIKMTQRLLAGAVALALSDVGFAQDSSPKPPDGASAHLATLVDADVAQDPLPEPLPGGPNVGIGGGVLQALPTPRDLPASLFAPSPPPSTGFLRVDAPYFVRDPLLDSPQFPAPGWFGGAEIQVVKPHLSSRLSQTVQNQAQRANGTSTTVALHPTSLDWTVSPRFFLGYRLPSGFGEFMLAYRFLDVTGGQNVRGGVGPVALKSRLAFNIIDFDYNSTELSLWPTCDMRWTVGIRILTNFYDTQANQPFDQAAAASGIYQARNFVNNIGFGPHAALELAQRLGNSGWALSFRGDASTAFTWGNEGAFARSTTLGPAGQPLVGESFTFFHQGTSILNFQTGVTWRPSSRPSATRLFLGYQYERWFALEGVVNSGSHGQLWDQGIVLQATFNY